MIWVFWVILLLFFVFSCFRRGSCCHGSHDHGSRSGSHSKHQDDIAIDQNTTLNETIKIKPSQSQGIRIIKCFKCGSEFPSTLTNCPVCGHERVRCMVSQLDIQYDDKVFYCPYCGTPAHLNHIREWIKVKAVCPNCQHKLNEEIVGKF